MKIYLAGHGTRHAHWVVDKFYDFYRLQSYYYINEKEKNLSSKYKDFILDSGVFSYLTSKKEQAKTLDWDKYIYDYAKYVKENHIQNYVEVDIDTVIGVDEVQKLTNKLEKLVGWKPMPVWHLNRGYDNWLKLCKDYEYICFGAFLTDNLSSKKFPMINKFLYDAAKQKTKVHGLGFTPMLLLPKYKFYSVDSTTWSAGHRFGEVHKFTGSIVEKNRFQKRRIKDPYALSKYNFYEWVKYSEYADINL